MAELDTAKITTTDMAAGVEDFSVSAKTLDSLEQAPETCWDNRDFSKYLGYYKENPAFKKPIDALGVWACGKGWTADAGTTVILEGIRGNGKQSFQTIMESHLVMKKVNGDAYTHIIRNPDSGTLINFKLLNPGRMKVFFDEQGLISRYEQVEANTKKTIRTFKPQEILHSINEPIGDEIHGTSVLEASQWVLDARQEAMEDWRKMFHRNLIGVRVIEIDEDDTDKLNILKEQWKDAINKGEVLIFPKGTVAFPSTDTQNPENWIRYLENPSQMAVGVPKVIMGGAAEFTEASSKVGYLTFDPTYTNEQLELEADLWNQCAIRVKFNRPAELGGTMQEDETKNTGQVGFQPKEAEATLERE